MLSCSVVRLLRGSWRRYHFGFRASLNLCGCFFAWLANDPPFFHVPSPRLDRDEPAIFDQRFGQTYFVYWISGAVGAINADISRGDDGLVPAIYHPAEELFAWKRSGMGRRDDWLRASPY